MNLLDSLTAEQRAAVEFDGPRLMLRASAGSGKTRVLTARYLRHVVQDGISPDSILAITFTTRAATEMRRRIVEQLRAEGLKDQAQLAETGPISTIHSFCERSLRENALAAALDPEYSVMPSDQVALLREEILLDEISLNHHDSPEIEMFLKEYAGKVSFGGGPLVHDEIARRVNHIMDSLRGTLWTTDHLGRRYLSAETLAEAYLTAMAGDPKPHSKFALQWENATKKKEEPYRGFQITCGAVQLAIRVWRRLESRLKRLYQLDYNLLESMLLRLLESDTLTAKRLRDQYQVVLVDEAQDLNPVQYRLLEELDPHQMMLVGDPQQSIYGFRNADSEQFVRRTRITPTLALTTNFRSESEVLRMVDAVFAERWGEDYSPMQARPDALKGSAATWAFPERDSHSLAELVRAVVQDNALGLPIPPRYSDIAILTRNKTHSQMYVTAMRKLSVPVRHEGSKRFYARMTLRDVANTLEAAARPNSDFALLCTLHSPIGGLSLDSVIQLAVKAKAAGTSVRAACSTFECPTAEDADALARFLAWFLPACEEADRIRAWELIGKILHHSPLQIQIARLPDAPLEVANLNKLLIMAVNQPTATPIEFADQLRKVLMLRHEEEDADWSSQSEESVTLMNVHQSKGLEFPLVIIPSVHENIRKVRSSGSLVHRGLGLVHVGKLEHSMASKWLKDRVADEGSAEEQRVLYVAMTRAEKGLLIGTAMKPSSWGKLVHESLEALAPDRGFPKWQQPE